MPPSRHPHNDPFTDAPLRPTSSNPTALRSQASQQSLRSNTSATSSRAARGLGQAQGQNTLFAPALSRRPTNRSTLVDEGGVLADSPASDEEDAENEGVVQRQRQFRGGRVAHGSPEGRQGNTALKGRVAMKGKAAKQHVQEEEETEFVNRRPDGSYLLGAPGTGIGMGEATAVPQMVDVPRSEEEVELEEVDAHYNAISRQYFASGAALGGGRGSSKGHEEELEQLRLPMMLRLREQVTEKLEGERWQYESVDRFSMAL